MSTLKKQITSRIEVQKKSRLTSPPTGGTKLPPVGGLWPASGRTLARQWAVRYVRTFHFRWGHYGWPKRKVERIKANARPAVYSQVDFIHRRS